MARKTNFVELLKLDQSNLDGFKVVNVTDENITKTSSYNLLIKALEIYNDRKFKNNERVTEFIKINLSINEEVARKQWFNGIEHDGYKYKAWFATVGGMKTEQNGICDTIFIREDYKEFANIIEDLVSLGKFKELENLSDDDERKTICINKDVLSRLSLITSDLITEIDMPNLIVLPKATLDYIEDYKTVRPIKYKETNEDGEEVDKVDYELIDYHFDTSKRDEDGNPIDEIECFDGSGIATPKIFESIGKSLGRNDIEFSIIRGYGLAIKGLITKFDIIEYLNSTYKNDTAYCRRVNGQFELLDRWNHWQPVTDNTMILNDSMVKLARYFDSMEEYIERICRLDSKYKDLLNKLYITKVNKKDTELSDYRRTNYQLMNALALTPADYNKLVEQDYKMLKKIIRPFDIKLSSNSNKEFEINTDYIKLFFKNIVDDDIEENGINYEEKLLEAMESSIVDKVNELISLDEDFVKLKTVKDSLGRLVEKKIRELASGKVTVKAKYQYMACCPISYMNHAIYKNQGENGLAKGQFYSADCKDGDIRTISRNPLSAYSEVHNVKFARKEYFDKWLSPCRELIYFNQKSDIQNLLSSADFDGDGLLQVDNSIIRNVVVTPGDGKYFITLSDREQKKLPYNSKNRFISTYKASGNLIGKIALKAANVNSNCQNIPDLYDIINNQFINWKDLKAEFETDGKTEEDLSTYIKEKLANGEFEYGTRASAELKERMIERFYEYEKEIYIILYNSMKSIDATKTLVFPDKADMEVIDSKYFKKAHFLRYKENRGDVIEKEYIYTYSLLDRFSKKVQKDLLDTIENRNKSKKDFRDRVDILQSKFKNNDYNEEKLNNCSVEIKQLYKDYTSERSKIRELYNADLQKIKELKSYIACNTKPNLNWLREESNQAKIDRNKGYSEVDKKYMPVANNIIEQFDLATVCQAISELPSCTENFIISLFFKCFEYINKPDNIRYIYKKCHDGDIGFLYERYKAIPVIGFDNSNVVERITTEEFIRKDLYKKIRLRFTDKSIVTEIEEAIEKGRTYSLNLKDNRISVYHDFLHMTKDKDILKVMNFDKYRNGKNSITNNSLGLIVQM